jgi:hypothetical protein
MHDCQATLHLLARPVRSGGSALNQLLTTARRPTWRIWAENSPDAKNRPVNAAQPITSFTGKLGPLA